MALVFISSLTRLFLPTPSGSLSKVRGEYALRPEGTCHCLLTQTMLQKASWRTSRAFNIIMAFSLLGAF